MLAKRHWTRRSTRWQLLPGALIILAGLVGYAHYQPAGEEAWRLTGSLSNQSDRVTAGTDATVSQPATQPNYLLSIPKLGSTIPLSDVGLNRDGEMAVPHDTNYAGWYKLGVKPGQTGSAVIDGHNQILGKGNGVFWNINKLTSGDDIYVQNGGGPRLHFVVRDRQIYDVANAPMSKIFGATDKARLNLVTCAGRWDKRQKTYTQRLVVYAELADSK